jgi:hypothetical protein
MDRKPPGNAGQRVLLLDLDNCPHEMAWLVDDLPRFRKVIACHGPVEPKLSLDLATQLSAALQAGQVEFFRMTRGGKNAADFGLAFLAGKLMAEFSARTEFVVLSNDTDLDHVVDMLRRFDRKAKRTNGRNFRIKGKSCRKHGTLPAEEFAENYLNRRDALPGHKTALRNAIRSFFGKRRKVDPDAVIQELVAREIVVFDGGGKTTYHLDSTTVSAETATPLPRIPTPSPGPPAKRPQSALQDAQPSPLCQPAPESNGNRANSKRRNAPPRQLEFDWPS